MPVRSGDLKTNCYFIADDTIAFRHKGVQAECPPTFYLRKEKQMADTVTLLFTSSGSGKTVELAASAVTREAALAVLISAKDTKRLGDAQEAYSKLCTEDTRKVEETTYDLTEEEAITTGEDQLTEAKQKDSRSPRRFCV